MVVVFTVRRTKFVKFMFYTCLSVILFTGGGSRPVTRGRDLPRGVSKPMPRGRGSARGDVQAQSQGVSRTRPGGVSQHALRQTPLTVDGYCCGRYASCWNAFLFVGHFACSLIFFALVRCQCAIRSHMYEELCTELIFLFGLTKNTSSIVKSV